MGSRYIVTVFCYLALFCLKLASFENPCESEELVVGGCCQDDPPQDTRALFEAYRVYRERASDFLSKTVQDVGPEGLLYVQHQEMAVTEPQDESVYILGSDDASSCIIAILRHTGSGAVGIAHFDGTATRDGVNRLVRKVKELTEQDAPDGRYELSMVGAVSDPNDVGEGVFSDVIYAFLKQSVEVHLVLACIGELNTREENHVQTSILYGAGVNIKTGEIFPATFLDKGPEATLRYARMITGGKVANFYDYNRRLFCISPFNYNPVDTLDDLLKLPDREFLEAASSTPNAEPPNFVKQVRETYIFIKENPDLSKTVFQDKKPHCYRQEERTGAWLPVDG